MRTRHDQSIEDLAKLYASQLTHADSEEVIAGFVAAEAAALSPETQRYLITLIMKLNEVASRERNLGPDGKPFVWGRVLKIHYVGDHYAIVEHDRNRPGNAKPDWSPHTSYSAYLKRDGEYRDLARSSESFDYALLTCIAWRHEDKHHGRDQAANSQAVKYFLRMVGP